MKIYYICECCDNIYKVTETVNPGSANTDLTENAAEDIIINEPENGRGFASGICNDCREEMYGAAESFVQPFRLH